MLDSYYEIEQDGGLYSATPFQTLNKRVECNALLLPPFGLTGSAEAVPRLSVEGQSDAGPEG